MAFLFVITAVIALFGYNLIIVVTDREAVKMMLSGLDEMVRETVPVLIAERVENEVSKRGFANFEIDEQQLDTAVNNLIPPGWIDTQTEAAVDGLYNYLETGDPATAETAVDLHPILTRLQGEEGKRMVTAVLRSLPTCTQPLPEFNLETGNVQIEGCLPPDVDVNVVADAVHTAVVQTINENPQILANAGVVRVSLLGQNSPLGITAEQQTQLEQASRNFRLARTWAWTLWLLPLACLFLILLLAVRSLPEWGHWWGWPMVIAAVIILFLSILAPAVLTIVARTAVTPANTDPLTLPLQNFVLDLLIAATDRWLLRVYLQAGIMLAFGVMFILIAFVARASFPGKQT
ncbi:MAG: hypothetical protein GY796_12715 [Chloroflexi bacterium]|nr:hypothetical protein [Chloroflexota bacterium]